MSDYKHILVAVDLSEDSELVCQRAASIAKSTDAELAVVHVVEYVPVEPMGEALLPAVQIDDELVENARDRVDELSTKLGLSNVTHRVEIGNIKSEVLGMAAEMDADLIVLGCRERHGLAILVNFTEDTVLHAANCDVLAVRLPQR